MRFTPKRPKTWSEIARKFITGLNNMRDSIASAIIMIVIDLITISRDKYTVSVIKIMASMIFFVLFLASCSWLCVNYTEYYIAAVISICLFVVVYVVRSPNVSIQNKSFYWCDTDKCWKELEN